VLKHVLEIGLNLAKKAGRLKALIYLVYMLGLGYALGFVWGLGMVF